MRTRHSSFFVILPREPLDGRLGERHPEVARLAQLMVVQLDQPRDGLVHGGELHEGHLAVLGKKLEGRDGEADGVERGPQVLLLDARRNVGQVQRGGRGVDVGVVLRAGLLEAVQRRRAVVKVCMITIKPDFD